MYQGYQPTVLDCAREYFHQLARVYRVEELFQVHINGVAISGCDVVLAFGECLMGIAPWPEPVAAVAELGLVERNEYLGNGLPDNPVHYRGDAQLPFLPVVLGYFYPADRIGAVFAPQYGRLQSFLI